MVAATQQPVSKIKQPTNSLKICTLYSSATPRNCDHPTFCMAKNMTYLGRCLCSITISGTLLFHRTTLGFGRIMDGPNYELILANWLNKVRP